MPRKPDRFERIVQGLRLDHISSPWAKQIPLDCWPSIEYRMIQLLRKEHRWVERAIQKNRTSIDNHRDAFDTAYVDGYMEACDDFLNMLKQRRK